MGQCCARRCRHVAAVIRRHGEKLVVEGFFKNLAELQYAADLATLEADPKRRDIAWRLDLGEDILDDRVRLSELSNWISHLARR